MAITDSASESRTVYRATEAEVTLASEWHGGQASMLYAVASTGALSLGTRRPAGCDTDAEWAEYLRDTLARELREVCSLADAWDQAVATAWLAELA